MEKNKIPSKNTLTFIENQSLVELYGLDVFNKIIYIGSIEPEETSKTVISNIRFLMGFYGNDLKEINLHINSSGGCVIETIAIYDFLEFVKSTGIIINCVVYGEASSAGFLITSMCNGERLAGSNAYFMVHELGGSSIFSSFTNMKNEFENTSRLMDTIYKILEKNSNKNIEWWKNTINSQDVYMTAQEVLEYGIITKIL